MLSEGQPCDEAVRYVHFLYDLRLCSLSLLVYGVLVFETVQTGLVTEFAFDIYVYGFGDVSQIVAFHNTWFSSPIMEALISAAVQMFFAWRIYVISRSLLLTGTIIFVSVMHFRERILTDPTICSSLSVK